MAIDLIGYFYAAIVAVGGVIGYVSADSIPSLAAGLTFGSLLALGAYFNSKLLPRPVLQLIVAAVLAGVMGARWYRTGKLMPPGMICLISSIMIVRNVVTYKRYLPIIGGDARK
ncbi:transmembrane protein 14 homolog [Teleopsis dalmanni]|uniref:transmembrane protein 14 homolog n=1 Tax=Teleopsis dalmanni TaxID=139649 RepID=UPI0018CE79A9|nr:transmembrane protein 14 homolog [Teleopsis dalmanni]